MQRSPLARLIFRFGAAGLVGGAFLVAHPGMTARADDGAPPPEIIVENAADIWDGEGAEWPRWSKHDAASAVVVDYSAWGLFMQDYSDPADDRAALDYVLVGGKAIGYLQDYLYALLQVPVSKLNRNEQLAYWLNLHNAQAVLTTTAALPLEEDNVRQVVMGSRWRDKVLEIEGEKLSLVDIERRIVMRQWSDPRVLYGLYLPSHGAPPLPRAPFTGNTVWKMLDEQARAFVNSSRALEIHGEQLHTSSLYFWDKGLFPREGAVIAHLRAFADPPLKARLAQFDTVTATYLNWRLNSFNSGYDPQQDRHRGS